MNWYIKGWKRAFDFGGRSRRLEYWSFTGMNALIAFILGLIIFLSQINGIGIEGALENLSTVYELAIFIPSISIIMRRLHDTNHSGLWLFIGLVPLIGAIVLLIFTIQDSDTGNNNYGSNPKSARSH